MIHPLQTISQNDPQWKGVQLGTTPGATIGAYGCYITSFSVLSSYYGFPITPPVLNQSFIDAGLFSSGDLVSSDSDLTIVFPSIHYVESQHYVNVPADLNILKTLLDDINTCVILEIDLGRNGVHFTPVIDCDGASVTIMNVWDGKAENLASVYGDPKTVILRFIVYHGTHDPLVCDPKSIRDMLVTKATNADTIANFFPDPKPNMVSPDGASDVIKRIQGIQEAYRVLSEQVRAGISPITPPGTPEPQVADTANASVSLPQPPKSILSYDLIDLLRKLFMKKGGS